MHRINYEFSIFSQDQNLIYGKDNIKDIHDYHIKMSILDKITTLNTSPRRQDEEYEYTSDFVEWFYQYIVREQGYPLYPILEKITHHPEYDCIKELCLNLINIHYPKNMDNEKLVILNENLKKWTIDTILKCM